VTDSGPPRIRIDDIEFSYVPETKVLRGIDIDIDAGEFVTIIGQNGSGKSTLVKHLIGLLKPDSGSVTVYDEDDTAYSTAEHPMGTLARIVGFVFQNPDDQIFHTNIYDELEYGLKNVGVPEADRGERIRSALEEVDLQTDGRQNPFQMGKGQRQRLAIASTLVMDPAVICVDEPTTGQDRKESQRIMEILKRYNERGRTIIAITHDIALAAEYTDRVIVVKDGSIIADGPPERVFLDPENLEETNIRPPQITQLGLELETRIEDKILDEMWLTTDDAYEDMLELFKSATAETASIEESDTNETPTDYRNHGRSH
jgi:energy-coupling factor transport system ATP-binding protein